MRCACKQVLGNLVNNAIKFTESGFVRVKVAYEYLDPPMVMVYVTVTDSGIGIPRHRLDLIFDAFSQGGSEITRRFGGTGLGLAITRRLIELQGGKISVLQRAWSWLHFQIPGCLSTISTGQHQQSHSCQSAIYCTNAFPRAAGRGQYH